MTSAPARRLLLVHAHPDDETLTTGGTMAHYAAAPDVAVTLVTCTLGEQGEVIPPELALLGPERADQLGGYRVGELAAACAALGVRDHRYLGGAGRWRDSGMALAGHGVRAALPEVLHPRAFAAPEAFAEQVDAARGRAGRGAPAGRRHATRADGGYGHPDHVRAHDVTEAAVARVPGVRKRYATVVGRAALEAGLAALAGADGACRSACPRPTSCPARRTRRSTTRIDVRRHRAARDRRHARPRHADRPWHADADPVAFAMSNGSPNRCSTSRSTSWSTRAAPDDLFAGRGWLNGPWTGPEDPAS